MEKRYSLILAVIRRGFSDVVMKAARSAGARGGTIVNARGTGSFEVEKFMGVTIEPEKEMVLILTEAEQRQEIMKAIYRDAGLSKEGNGLAIALPVEDVVGVFKLTN